MDELVQAVEDRIRAPDSRGSSRPLCGTRSSRPLCGARSSRPSNGHYFDEFFKSGKVSGVARVEPC
jgi:hypothetical protein